MTDKKNEVSPRVDAFARELATALRRITGREVQTKPMSLPEPINEKAKETPVKSGK